MLESFPAQSGNVPRAPSLDAARQFTLSQVVLWSVVRCMAGQGVLFLSLKMRQNSIESLPRFIGYDILFLDTGDDPDRTAAAATDLDRAAFGSILKTRFSRWAQVIPDKAGQALAAWCSADERTSALEMDFMP